MARVMCSECPTVIPGARPTQKTCSPACRAKRSRRMKRARTEAARVAGEANALPEHLQALSHAAHGEAKHVAHELLKEEMKPVVREAITEDVLKAVNDLVALTPTMVAAIQEDLQSNDKILRQKAYSLLARYTLGNPSVAPASAAAQPAPMQVIFQLPRPGDDGAPVAVEADAEELRTCMECHETKPAGAFVANSERCQGCHDALQEKVRARFA